jgi:hypothetical protein
MNHYKTPSLFKGRWIHSKSEDGRVLHYTQNHIKTNNFVIPVPMEMGNLKLQIQ